MTHFRRTLLSPYHYLWALLSALWYRFPTRSLITIGVTGTKGKSSVTEMLYAILSSTGHPTALASTIRFAIADESRPNLFKMTLPGHGFIQKFLAEAVAKKATHAIVEITSEGVLQSRHCFLDLDALIFTNLQKEHLESHGSMEKYFCAKFRIAKMLMRSPKRPRAIIANTDDTYGERFLATHLEQSIPFSRTDAIDPHVGENSVSFVYKGIYFNIPQPGMFSIMNALAAIKTAEFLGIPLKESALALKKLTLIPGRAENINVGQDFLAIVDYAHTPDSLKALYDAFPNRRKICVLGNTGGGRDTWKRSEMGKIADTYCAEVFLTNEDPYDEDPISIIEAMAKDMRKKPKIIMDRREAIRTALTAANSRDAIFITGKGTDPFIMGPRSTKTPWSDSQVVREELEKLLTHKKKQ